MSDVFSWTFVPRIDYLIRTVALWVNITIIVEVSIVNNRISKIMNSIEANSSGRKTTERNCPWSSSEMTSNAKMERMISDAGKNTRACAARIACKQLRCKFTGNFKVCEIVMFKFDLLFALLSMSQQFKVRLPNPGIKTSNW